MHTLKDRTIQVMAAVVVSLTLSGCASSPKAPVQVESRSHGHVAGSVATHAVQPVTTGQYVVQGGDTLYSIAFRYGWDWKTLAAHNGIGAPYVIRPGQRIRFSSAAQQQAAVAQPSAISTPITSPPASNSGAVTAKAQTVKQPTIASNQAKPVTALAPAVISKQGWIWPTQGNVIGRFSSNGSLNKGVDIAGNLGQPVVSASDGAVVYAGSGLRGYGELIIIKHGDTYVSAYGHNRRLLVREGQQVKAGQQIAEMGSTGTDRVKLHFEIRRQGKPVDPLQYLPRR